MIKTNNIVQLEQNKSDVVSSVKITSDSEIKLPSNLFTVDEPQKNKCRIDFWF